MKVSMDQILYSAHIYGASDIHLLAGLPPAWRVNGSIILGEAEPFTSEELTELVMEPLSAVQKEKLEKDMALCYSLVHETGRYRVAIYLRNGKPELAIRVCSTDIRTRTELGLPPQIDELIDKPSGLVLVTGPTGSGKTTTLNYLIDQINSRRSCKIIMIEDPIEYVHAHKKALIVQQELYTDVTSFNTGLIHILRQDPDVICVGEMRDYDTIATALTAAETGHLVFATLHTPGIVQTVERIISVFSADQQPQIIQQLANSLQGILSQQLIPTIDQKARVLAYELLLMDPAVRNIIRERQFHQLYTQLETGQKRGLCTLDHSLQNLYEAGKISYDSLLSHAIYPEAFRAHYNHSGI